MAHFAKVENGTVTQVIVAEKQYIETLSNPNEWVQTSYNVKGGIYYDNATWQPVDNQAEAIAEQDGRQRKNYAGIGFIYDSERDAFIPPKPYDSWVLDEDTCWWQAPIPYPEDDNDYKWNEETKEWKLFEEEITEE
jgi:hypothetical protein